MNSEMEGKKTRRPRFTDSEALALVEEVEARSAVILGKLDSRITAEKKAKAWEEVTVQVNVASKVGDRTPDEVRKKFIDLRSSAKIKASKEDNHVQGTGEFIGFVDRIFVTIVANIFVRLTEQRDRINEMKLL